MSCDQITFTGNILGGKKTGLTGARLDLVDTKTKNLVASTLSGDDGFYVINLYRRDAPEEFDRIAGRKLDLVVQSSSSRPLAKKSGLVCKQGEFCLTNIRLSPAAIRRFNPEATQLDRVSGSMLDGSGKEFLDTAIAAVFPLGSPAHNRYSRAALCPGPDIDIFDSLLDDAWGSIDGDPRAERRFRQTLDLIGRRLPVSRGGPLPQKGLALLKRAGIEAGHFELKGFDIPFRQNSFQFNLASTSSALSFIPDPNGPIGGRRPCLLPPSRLLPPYIAAARASRSFNDAAYLFGALEEGLCGIGVLGQLMDAAAEGFSRGNFGRMRGMLGFMAGECGPDDGPLPPWPEPGPNPGPCPEPPQPPDLFPDPCEVERLECVMQIARNIGRLQGSGITYSISSIAPNDACPSSLIVITGINFGNTPGQVCFPQGSISAGITCVVAQSWTDTEIRVVVPAGAGAGDVYLKIIEGQVTICGKVFLISRQGGGATFFVGGRASVSSLTVNGRSTNVWAEADRDLTIGWVASRGGAGTLVRIRLSEGPTTILDQSGLPDQGSIVWHAPGDGQEHNYRLRCDATHSCGNDSRTLDFLVTIESELSIQGMEITQATQFYLSAQHLPAGTFGADNSVPLIENKRTLVRVYLDSGLDGFNLGDGIGVVSGITGKLYARSDGSNLPGSPINSLRSMNALRNNPYLQTRGNINRTLNFELPGAWRSGNVQLRVVVDPDNDLPRRHSGILGQTQNITFVAARTLKLVGVMIRYTGWQLNAAGNRVRVNRPAPALSSLVTAANWLRRTYPVNSIDFFTAPGNESITFSGDLTDGSGGGCGDEWGDLMDEIRDLADDYSGDDDAVWVGVLPTGWSGAAWGGCGGSSSDAIGAAVIFSNDTGPVLAQEAGHGYGRGHAPGCGAAGADASYPAYGKTSTASIGEFGVDWPAPGTTNWIIQDPNIAPGARNDFMGYCGSDWVSPYTYQALFNGGISPSSSLPGGPSHHGSHAHSRLDKEEDLLVLRGRIWKSGQVELKPSFHFPRKNKPPSDSESGYLVELQDAKGRSIDIRPIFLQESEEPTAAVIHFSVTMPVSPKARRLLILYDEKMIHEQAIAKRPPIIKKLSTTKSDKKGNKLQVSLDVDCPDSKTWQKLRYSNDEGESWYPLVCLTSEISMEVDLSQLPGGKRCVIEAYCSDGILTGRAKSKPFKVGHKKPRAIISTEDGSFKVKGGAIRLLGAGLDDAGKPVSTDRLSWSSDKDGDLGAGDLLETPLSRGTHKISLVVKDDEGRVSRENITLQVN